MGKGLKAVGKGLSVSPSPRIIQAVSCADRNPRASPVPVGQNGWRERERGNFVIFIAVVLC